MMRKVIGETIGWTGLAMVGAALLYGVWNFAIHVVPVLWQVVASGDLVAITWLGLLVGFLLFAVGATIVPDEEQP